MLRALWPLVLICALKWEVTDALQGDSAGLQERTFRVDRGGKAYGFCKANAACIAWFASRRSIQQTPAHEVFQRGHPGELSDLLETDIVIPKV